MKVARADDRRSRDVYINGRFLMQKLSGVQRYAREVVRALDDLIAHDDWAARRRWILLAPVGRLDDLGLRNIVVEQVWPGQGHLWEQVTLLERSRHGLLLDLGNAGPIFHPRHLVVIHDATVFRHPRNFSLRYATAHQLLGRALSKTARLATVSNFSKRELSEVFAFPQDEILVAPNAASHLLGLSEEPAVLRKLRIAPKEYFLFVGSPTKTKNLQTAIRGFLALRRPDIKFVIVGGIAKGVFGQSNIDMTENVIMAGRLSDGEVTSLYRNALSLVFASIYEGFGIPPIEAMANDCPVIAADIPPVREVCGDAAAYFPPLDDVELGRLLQNALVGDLNREDMIAQGKRRVAAYDWSATAKTLLGGLRSLA